MPKKRAKLNSEAEAKLKQKREERYQLAVHFVIRTKQANPIQLQTYVKVPFEEGGFLATNYEASKLMLKRMAKENIIKEIEHTNGDQNVFFTYEVVRKRAPFSLSFELNKHLKKIIREKNKKEEYREKSGEVFIQAINEWIQEETGFSYKEICEEENRQIYEVKTEYIHGRYHKMLLKNKELISTRTFDMEELMKKVS